MGFEHLISTLHEHFKSDWEELLNSLCQRHFLLQNMSFLALSARLSNHLVLMIAKVKQEQHVPFKIIAKLGRQWLNRLIILKHVIYASYSPNFPFSSLLDLLNILIFTIFFFQWQMFSCVCISDRSDTFSLIVSFITAQHFKNFHLRKKKSSEWREFLWLSIRESAFY